MKAERHARKIFRNIEINRCVIGGIGSDDDERVDRARCAITHEIGERTAIACHRLDEIDGRGKPRIDPMHQSLRRWRQTSSAQYQRGAVVRGQIVGRLLEETRSLLRHGRVAQSGPERIGDGKRCLGHQTRVQCKAMVRLGTGQSRCGFDGIESRKCGLRCAMRGEAARIAYLIRTMADRISVEREDDVGAIEPRHASSGRP